MEDQNSLVTRLRLRIHASNLPRYGILKIPSDTYAKITSVSNAAATSGPEVSEASSIDGRGMRNIEWGTTELVRRCDSPQYTATFPLKYEYGAECYFYVQLYRNNGGKSKPTLLGSALYEVGDILGTRNQTKAKRLRKGGCVFCRLEAVQKDTEHSLVRFQMSGKELDVSRFSLSMVTGNSYHSEPDTVLEISKRHSETNKQAWTTVYRSRPVENSSNPTWDVGEVNFSTLCDGDSSRPIKLTVKVHRKTSQDVTIGFCETTLTVLLRTQHDLEPDDPCYDVATNGFIIQRSISKTKEVGRLCVDLVQLFDNNDGVTSAADLDRMSSITLDDAVDASSEGFVMTEAAAMPAPINVIAMPVPTVAPARFQDYIDDGCKLNFHVAIDFTSSNGDPRIAGNLHHQGGENFNDYEETICSIGDSIVKYTDEISVWGFGAKFNGSVQNLFQCGPERTVNSVDGIINSYKSMFQSDLVMSGPTVFDSVIKAAAVGAKRQQTAGTGLRYTVLLIITDGIMNQAEETKRKLNVYSAVPLSVIFVGVGRADFKSMYSLCTPYPGNRPNVTFCEYRQYQHTPAALGKAALSEMPNQLVEYMQVNNIGPSSTNGKH